MRDNHQALGQRQAGVTDLVSIFAVSKSAARLCAAGGLLLNSQQPMQDDDILNLRLRMSTPPSQAWTVVPQDGQCVH